MTTKRFADYYCRQQDWWRNMDNIVINYRHMGECSLRWVHMVGKCRIDKLGGTSKVCGCRL